jgi:hypothetical protein
VLDHDYRFVMVLKFNELALVGIVKRNSICFGINNRLLQKADDTLNWQEVPLNFSGSTAFAQKDTRLIFEGPHCSLHAFANPQLLFSTGWQKDLLLYERC